MIMKQEFRTLEVKSRLNRLSLNNKLSKMKMYALNGVIFTYKAEYVCRVSEFNF